jgi:thioredoxin reductase (NADPH)
VEPQSFEIVIVGGGPIGLACGLEARNAGLSFVILEKGALVNSLYNYPVNMTFFSTSELLEIGGIPFISDRPKPVRQEALEYYRRVALSNKLPVHLFEKVEKIVPGDPKHTVITNRATYRATHVIIATGFYDIPVQLGIPGEDLAKVTHYYKDPHFYAMQDVLVVGANNSAVDAALETFRKGARVTMVIRGSGIGKRVKYWKKPDIENRIREGSIKALFNSRLLEIREKEAVLQTPDGKITVPNDYVIAMTGYEPDFAFLDKIGISHSQDEKKCPTYNGQTMETNVSRVYLAGVVCGGMNTHEWFIENSREHAIKIIGKIAGEKAMKEPANGQPVIL